jgi:phosphoglycerate dehydrogenase-like enzyme
MLNGAYFLNTARGEIVDEWSMIENLKSGKLKAAAVDVISNETHLEKWNHPVIKYAREHENLIVSPHTAGLTIDSESKAAIEILNEINKALNV